MGDEMKIVVLDGYTENPGDLSWDSLGALGDLTVYDRTPKEQVIERIGDAEAVYVNKVPIDRKVMDKCPSIRFIGVLATGYNVIDVEAAREKGIVVCNVPTYGTSSVAQYAIALLLELCHHAGEHSACVKAGEWTKNEDWCFWKYPLIELSGKKMGIIGFGRIGQMTGRLAAAFGMEVLAFDSHPAADMEIEGCRYAALDEVIESADVISLHCPLFPETREIINKETISRMKDGVMIINTSRGPLICEKDLADALKSGKVAGAAVDVVSVEPVQEDNPLLKAPNIIITPHIAWAPKESRQRLMDVAVGNLRAYLAGGPVNVGNR